MTPAAMPRPTAGPQPKPFLPHACASLEVATDPTASVRAATATAASLVTLVMIQSFLIFRGACAPFHDRLVARALERVHGIGKGRDLREILGSRQCVPGTRASLGRALTLACSVCAETNKRDSGGMADPEIVRPA